MNLGPHCGLATHHNWLQWNSSAIRPQVRPKLAPQVPVTWYLSTGDDQHSCRSANTSISMSLLVLPWFWLSCSSCCFSFMGHLGGQGGRAVLDPSLGELQFLLCLPVWTHRFSTGFEGSVCSFPAGIQTYSFFSQKRSQPRPKIERTEDKLKSHRFLWPWHSAFLPF